MSIEAIKEIEKSLKKIENLLNLLEIHKLVHLRHAIQVQLVNIDHFLEDVKFNQKLD